MDKKIIYKILFVAALLLFAIVLKKGLTITVSNNNFNIRNGLHDQMYYAELFDPIYYSYNFEEHQNIYSQPKLNRYSECAEYELDLYPEDFLKELEKSQITHNRYFRNPTHDNLHLMIDQQYNTAFAYIADNQKFLQSLLDIDEEINFVMQNDKVITLENLRQYFIKNIDNGYAMVEKIHNREKKYSHKGTSIYNIESYPMPQLSRTDTIDISDMLTKDEALKMLKLYVESSKDDVSTQKKIDSYTVNDLFLTKIPLTCYDGKYTEIYGVDDDFYAHMFYANIHGQTGIVEDYKYKGVWDMPFAGCNCPFIEEDRISFYLIKYIQEEIITNEYLGETNIEKKFINSPTYNNMKIVSDLYEKEIKLSLMSNNIDKETNAMWRVYNQINTKYFLYDEAYNDINPKESMKYFEGPSDDICEEYQNYVLVESMFHLNFMRWSEAVFILDDTMELEDYTERENKINISDERDFLYNILNK